MRWERLQKLKARYAQIVGELGEAVPSKQIPLKDALPLIEAASLEDDEILREMWARLLVNSTVASRKIDLRRTYIDILQRLSPLEVSILDGVYGLPDEVRTGVLTGELPEKASFGSEVEENDRSTPNEDVKMALSNLVALGCLTFPSTWDGGEIYTSVYRTLLGRSFVLACADPVRH